MSQSLPVVQKRKDFASSEHLAALKNLIILLQLMSVCESTHKFAQAHALSFFYSAIPGLRLPRMGELFLRESELD